MYFDNICEKLNRVITAPHCIVLPLAPPLNKSCPRCRQSVGSRVSFLTEISCSWGAFLLIWNRFNPSMESNRKLRSQWSVWCNYLSIHTLHNEHNHTCWNEKLIYMSKLGPNEIHNELSICWIDLTAIYQYQCCVAYFNCGIMAPYGGTHLWATIGSVNGLLPDGNPHQGEENVPGIWRHVGHCASSRFNSSGFVWNERTKLLQMYSEAWLYEKPRRYPGRARFICGSGTGICRRYIPMFLDCMSRIGTIMCACSVAARACGE